MKEIIGLDGNLKQVPIDTPVKCTGRGLEEYTADELLYINSREAAWAAGATHRAAMDEIHRLEAEITPRRQREAILGTDNGWLANQESLIAIERAKL